MGVDLQRFKTEGWWWEGGQRPPISLIRGLLTRECLAPKVPADADEYDVLMPVVGSLVFYRSGAIKMRSYIGNRFRCDNIQSLLEALDNLSGIGLRWGECLFRTDEPQAYRLAPWAWKTKPSFAPCYWNPGPTEGRGQGDTDGG